VDERVDPLLAALLKRLREERDVTQEQLAFDAGVTVSTLSRIERGLNSPGWATVTRIADALSVSMAELAGQLEQAHRAARDVQRRDEAHQRGDARI
jgi:transcriptional regulator with XRE-family HTH domain